MRIEPKRDTLASLQPSTSAEQADGFANALKSAKGSFSETPSLADSAAEDGPPLAERWGQYGTGATAAGFGAPNPDLYVNAPVGPNAPASPLNPGGVSTTPSFVVSGYTGRGTPVPPGFYNLAYYNQYLQEGGTPLEGFPQFDDGSTLRATYGTFGDGAKRATSFLTGLVDDTADQPAAAAAVATAVVDDGRGATAAPATAPVRPGTAAAPAASPLAAATPASATSAAATGTAEPPATPIATSDPAALLRTELAALLGDLLRSA